MSVPRLTPVPKLLTVKQVAEITGLQRFRVYEAIRSGGMPYIPFGRTYRVPEDGLARWIAEQTEAADR